MTDEQTNHDMADDFEHETGEIEPVQPVAPENEVPFQIEVRRNVVLSGVVGTVSAVLAAAFALRAFDGGGPVDWVGFGLLGVITVLHLAAVADGRAPLMVFDDHGVRLREGARWRGVSWPDIDCLEHNPRHGLRDGHLLVVCHEDQPADQQLIVPLTLATRLVGADRRGLRDTLAERAAGRADVVVVVPGLPDADPTAYDEVSDPIEPTDPIDEPVAVVAESDQTDELAAVEPDSATPDPVAPGRATAPAARVEVDRASVTAALPEPAAATPEETVTVVLGEAVDPAKQPVIGPELAAARGRLRLTVDQLAERTRIRPHVIEAIEVDDFAPCGGDFYARGHLRTLARVLGIDATPLLADYEERYADAPVDPRRVFESELATGVGGSIRGTRGGRNWSVLIAAIMGAVLVWSVARLVMDGPVAVDNPQIMNSGGISHHKQDKVPAVELTLTATGGGAEVVVRDGRGDVVFDGPLAFGETAQLDAVPPMRIWTSDGSVSAAVDGGDQKALGETGQEVTTTLVAP